MRFRLPTYPAQDEVNRRHRLYFHGIRIQGVLARSQRRTPNPTLSRFNLFAITERLTGTIAARAPVVRNNHTDVADRNQRFGFDLTAPNQRLVKNVPSVSTCSCLPRRPPNARKASGS